MTSELYELSRAVTCALEALHGHDPIGLVRAKGELATRAGFLVSMVSRSDPDDPVRLANLRRAAYELGLPLR